MFKEKIQEKSIKFLLFDAKFLKQKAYWTKRLSGDFDSLPLLSALNKSHSGTRERTQTEIHFPPDLGRRLITLSKGSDISIYIILLSALKCLIHRYTSIEDTIVLSPVNQLKTTEETINQLVFIRDRLNDTLTFKELILSVRQSVLEAYENQDYPFDKLVEYLFPSPGEQKRQVSSYILCSLDNLHRARGIENINAGLSFRWARTGDRFKGHVSYDANTYQDDEVARISDHYIHLLSNALENVNLKIAKFSFLPEKEKKQLLEEFNHNRADFCRERTVYHFITEQAEKRPDAVAIVYKNDVITYRGLDSRTWALARYLRSRGVKEDKTTGILLHRSPHMVESILAVWKAGGAYIPLDPAYPQQRLMEILQDSQTEVLITTSEYVPPNSDFEASVKTQVIRLDKQEKEKSKIEETEPDPGTRDPRINMKNLSYVIYTSGSTGKAKGAMVEHIGMMNHLHAKIRDLQLNETSIIVQNASHTFDISVWQFFAALLLGGKTMIYPEEWVFNPEQLISGLINHQVTILEVVPSYLSVMLEFLYANFRPLTTLKYLLVTGEAVSLGLVKRWFRKYPEIKMVNAYGPTEASDDITHLIMEQAPDNQQVPIGKPVQNFNIYIVDKNMKLCPLGVKGEICVAGIGVGRGYLNKPELTAERFRRAVIRHSSLVTGSSKSSPNDRSPKFFPNDQWPMTNDSSPFKLSPNDRSPKFFPNDQFSFPHYPITPSPHSPIYLTGDLGRWLADGTIEFFGRKDYQVKIRGFRIELGEIESQLTCHPEIQEAVVVVKDSVGADTAGEKYLQAYLVTRTPLDIPGLKQYLSQRLPSYMVPEQYLELEQMPLTANGKIDRKALSKLDTSIAAATTYVAPRNQREEKLLDIWSQLLDEEKENIGIDANFFQLGGHSLKATIMTAKIHKKFRINLPLNKVFEFPTIRELARYLENRSQDSFESIAAREEKEYYQLSSAQKRLYFLQQMDADGIAYNIPVVLMLEGDVDKERLENTFRKLIARHESLRTSFTMMNQEPVQRIHKENYTFRMTNYTQAANENRLIDDTIKKFIRPFDLSRAPLLRVGLMNRGHSSQQGGEDKHILMIDMHHIISDGVSQNILVRDFMSLYGSRELPALNLSYKDYSEWQKNEKEQTPMKQQEEFWLKEFSSQEEIPVLELPTDYVRPTVQRFEGSAFKFEIEGNETRALKELALEEGTTLFTVLLSIYNIFLAKLCQQEVIVVGTPIAGRHHADLQKIIGIFINTLAIKSYPAGVKSWGEFLREVKEKVLTVFANQEYQYEELVEKVSINRDMGRNPLFDTMFILQNMDISEFHIPGLKLKAHQVERTTSKFDLTLQCIEIDDSLSFTFEYSTKLFKTETIARMVGFYQKIIRSILENPREKIEDIEIISQEEKKLVLEGFNNTAADYPARETIHQLFQQQVEKTPHRTAVVFETQFITYEELNIRAAGLAFYLHGKGVEQDSIVSIMADRSLGMIIGFLAVLKTRGAYLPIDPGYPSERINYMLEDSHTKILLAATETQVKINNEIKEKSIEIIDISNSRRSTLSTSALSSIPPSSFSKVTPISPSAPAAAADSLAYVIYTSGTTGKPKGVMITHRNLVRLFFNSKNPFDFNCHDVWTMFHSPCFDFSVWEMYGALLYGGKLIIIPAVTARDTRQFLDVLEIHQVTVLNQTPSAFYSLINEEFLSDNTPLSLRYIIFGGEALAPGKLKQWKQRYPRTRLINMYGITETTVHVTFKEITTREIEQNISNIGRPIPTLKTTIRDCNLRPVPIGVTGELCVSGDGVARGYLNRPELTSEKFAANPGKPGEPLYRSGDLARFLESGEMVYQGRKDHQVQLRGFRIELEEIKNRLLTCKQVKEALVVPHKDRAGDTCLCAYFVPHHEKDLDQSSSITGTLKNHLSKSLPGYMIPSFFVPVDKIPLTPNGKVDRKNLPQPEIGDQAETYIAPGNPIEKQLVEIWADVLGIEKNRISIDANFFALGGHSLKATLLTSKIHKEFNVKISLAEIFHSPTIRGFSRYITGVNQEKHQVIAPAERSDYYPLSSAQKRLFILDRLQGKEKGVAYNMPEAFILEGKLDKRKFDRAFNQLIRRHQTFRTSFHLIDRTPMQKINHPVELEVKYDQCSEEEARQRSKAFVKPFDLSRAPLLRVELLQTAENRYYVLCDIHHIIYDGISRNILVKEFSSLYRGKTLEPLSVQYKDYAVWQHRQLNEGFLKAKEQYWLKNLQGFSFTQLPIDYHDSYNHVEGKKESLEIGTSTYDQIEAFCHQHHITKFVFMITVFEIVLAREIDHNDITIGIPASIRNHFDLKRLIGIFLNVLLIRSKIDDDDTFLNHLINSKKTIVEALNNQDYPYEVLKAKMTETTHLKQEELFSILFNYFPLEEESQLSNHEFNIRPLKTQEISPKYDITLYVFDAHEYMVLNLVYKSNLYDEYSIKSLLENFLHVIHLVLENEDMTISGLTPAFEENDDDLDNELGRYYDIN